MRVEGDTVKVVGKIEDKKVVALINKKLIEPYFGYCKKEFYNFNNNKIKYYASCSNIKLGVEVIL